jgi:hypothetical protein
MSVVRFEKQLKASTHRQRPFPRFVYSKRERRLDPDPPSPEELAGFRFWAPSETEVGSWRWELSRHARIRASLVVGGSFKTCSRKRKFHLNPAAIWGAHCRVLRNQNKSTVSMIRIIG